MPMPNLVNIFKNYLPVRLLTGREPSVRRVIAPEHTLIPVGLQDFLALEIPAREMLLAPILPERSLSMLYAPRGIGKSWLGLSIGLAVASGGTLLRWTAPRPRRVLYVDGEMPLSELQLRLMSISAGLEVRVPPGGFQILAADNSERGINLSNEEGQRALEPHLEGVDLVILDNLSTLLATGRVPSGMWLEFGGAISGDMKVSFQAARSIG
jgi:hypothetical protein